MTTIHASAFFPNGGLEAIQPSGATKPSDISLDLLIAGGEVDFSRQFGTQGDVLGDFLSLALLLTKAIQCVHGQGAIHGAITPAAIHVCLAEPSAHLLPGDLRSAHWLAYAAPEQTGRMNRWIDQRTDLHALGVIFYELLTGQLPFAAGDPLGLVHALMAAQPAPMIQLRPDLPVPVSDIVARLLARDPRDRYQSAAGLAHDLARCQANWQSAG